MGILPNKELEVGKYCKEEWEWDFGGMWEWEFWLQEWKYDHCTKKKFDGEWEYIVGNLIISLQKRGNLDAQHTPFTICSSEIRFAHITSVYKINW